MINKNYQQSFNGRSKIIRDADAVCRVVKREFPSISPSMLDVRTKGEEVDGFYLPKFDDKFRFLFFKMNSKLSISRFISKIRNAESGLMKTIKESKLMNCGENAKLAKAISALNGSKNVNTFVMFKYNKKEGVYEDVDHMVTVLNYKLPKNCEVFKEDIEPNKNNMLKLSKDSIIIDPWLGFADYANTAVTRFKSEYAKILEINPNDNIFFMPTSKHNIPEEELFDIEELYPKLLLKNINLNA